jgi:hypothetical protein
MYGGSIIALDRTSLGSPPTVLATGLSGPGRVRADGSYVYFCDNTGLLSKVNVSGTPVTTNLATAYTNAQTLSVANGWICWPDADMSSGRFVRCAPTDPDAGSALTLYSTSVLVRDVATDGTTVYWVLADGSLYEKSIAAGEAGTATMIDNFSATRLELGSSGLLYLSSAGVYNLSLSTFVPQQLVPVASPVDLQPWVDFVYFTTASSVYQGNAYVAGPGTLLGSYGNVTQVAGDGSQVFFVTNGRQVRQAN